MSCALCGGPLRRGQYFVRAQVLVTLTDAYGQQYAEPVVMEDGEWLKRVCLGCILKRCPELVGALNGGLRT